MTFLGESMWEREEFPGTASEKPNLFKKNQFKKNPQNIICFRRIFLGMTEI